MRPRAIGGLVPLLCLVLAGPAPAAAEDADLATLKSARVPTDGVGLLDYIRERTLSTADEDRIKSLVEDLGDDQFERRMGASQNLLALGNRAVPYLRKASTDEDVERSYRATKCLRQIEAGTHATVVSAAVRQIGRLRPEGAADVLLRYLTAAETEAVADSVRSSLTAVAVRDGKAEPVLVAALADKSPARRAAAALALLHSDAPDTRPAVRKLLADTDPGVRFRVAAALTFSAKEKDALPVLIDLLDKVAVPDAGRIEDLLVRLAGDKAPSVVLAADEASRRKHRDAWKEWWDKAKDGVDLAKAPAEHPHKNHTLVVLLDLGRVIDLDGDKKARWQFDNAGFPLDAQYLPGDRVVLAEHNANKVTERNRTGQVIWEKSVEQPIVAQRLPSGNTFIASKTQLLEVNADGKEVFTYSRPGGETFMKAMKLPNGNLATVVQGQPGGPARYVLLDSSGKELKTFGIELATSGGRIDVLANGNVVVPEMRSNRVAEYDPDGKVVWTATLEQPVAAVRLANGNTLVTSMTQMRAVEIDKAGKEVWEYKADTRVTRALRR